MLYCLAGILQPDSGEVLFNGRDLCRMSDDERSDVRRRHFGFVFQFADLVPELTLRENIELPLTLNGVGRRDRRKRVAELVETLGLQGQAGRRPAFVSGGQAQRAAVARALAHRPAVLFADEPTGALDTENGAVVFNALIELANGSGAAVVLVTHDNALAARAHRVVTMRDGKTDEESW
ncbi:ABC transporter ATP-binding protein [Couchioplanes caeruleus subsp. azureus]|nr:ABC transporter ATP-binding protein [Couchioplanes caeruleus subsp. azureus]